ncbi:MAG: carcinine hydrolase/isopenicillin-N N-acyltransferase family protein, partial [Pseudomonadota bacterium]
PAGMGCTGFFASADGTADGKALHARTFDGAFFAWNEAPVLHLIDERDTNGAWHPYVATGTAGLIYPGGISGLNDAGIACSLHQMSTVNYATDRRGEGGYDVAPFVQQRILREAGSLDEAVAIAEGARHFASWAIVVSEARTGKALRIEINGREDENGHYDGKVVASTAEPSLVQTNHFLLDGMTETLDFWDDAHFTKTVGKWLETRARRATVTGRLAQLTDNALLDTEEALGLMANHDDAAVGGARRSFGRTVCKAYGLMGSIARTTADRAAGGDAIWFTIGDRLPGPHAAMAGFAIDWSTGSLSPAGDAAAQTVPQPYRAAMEAYVAAFRAYARPTLGGRYLGRRPTEEEMHAIRRNALGHLDRAVDLAEGAGIMDPAFRYIRARLNHEAGRHETGAERTAFLNAAARDWAHLRGLADSHAVPMHAWERALVFLLSAATDHARDAGTEAERDAMIARGRAEIDTVAAAEFPGGQLHQDIKDWRKVAATIAAEGDTDSLPPIDWVTVE